MKVKVVVFDLGNVLVRWEPERPYRTLIPDEAARQRFLSEIKVTANLQQQVRYQLADVAGLPLGEVRVRVEDIVD